MCTYMLVCVTRRRQSWHNTLFEGSQCFTFKELSEENLNSSAMENTGSNLMTDNLGGRYSRSLVTWRLHVWIPGQMAQNWQNDSSQPESLKSQDQILLPLRPQNSACLGVFGWVGMQKINFPHQNEQSSIIIYCIKNHLKEGNWEVVKQHF